MSRRCTPRAETSLTDGVGPRLPGDVGAAGRELSPFLVSIAAGPDGQPVEDAGPARTPSTPALRSPATNRSIRWPNRSFPHPLWRRAKGDRQQAVRGLPPEPAGLRVDGAVEEQPRPVLRPADRLRDRPKTGEEVAHLEGQTRRKAATSWSSSSTLASPRRKRMALQASIYDPVRDQTEARQAFPLPPARHLRAGLRPRDAHPQRLLRPAAAVREGVRQLAWALPAGGVRGEPDRTCDSSGSTATPASRR